MYNACTSSAVLKDTSKYYGAVMCFWLSYVSDSRFSLSDNIQNWRFFFKYLEHLTYEISFRLYPYIHLQNYAVWNG